ncbi:hypothetical protein [Spirosoma panaciterrae]|uniref:hypothetical protein n=1 Tax=Spirosoma panaciterrae TaxID=496058 RepID=UPI0012FB8959|nr:hypothetical protein [Spirosoma panaciterrae]
MPQKASSVSAEAFIRLNRDLVGIEAEALPNQLSQRLQQTPVRYDTILDGIALFRAFVTSLEEPTHSHYALLLRDWLIIGIERIKPEVGAPSYSLPTRAKDNQRIIAEVLRLGANKLLMGSICWNELLPANALKEIERVRESFDCFGIDHIDWLFLAPDFNTGYVPMALGEEALDDEVTMELYQQYYVDYSNSQAI